MSKLKFSDISKEQANFESLKRQLLGRKSELEISIKAIKALFDYANGIRQAANISNASLSQNAKDGAQYIQDISQLMQDIRQLKKSLDDNLDLIDATVYPEDEVDQVPPPRNNGEVIS